MKTDFQTGSTTAYIPLTRVFTPEKISFVIVVFMAKKSCFFDSESLPWFLKRAWQRKLAVRPKFSWCLFSFFSLHPISRVFFSRYLFYLISALFIDFLSTFDLSLCSSPLFGRNTFQYFWIFSSNFMPQLWMCALILWLLQLGPYSHNFLVGEFRI